MCQIHIFLFFIHHDTILHTIIVDSTNSSKNDATETEPDITINAISYELILFVSSCLFNVINITPADTISDIVSQKIVLNMYTTFAIFLCPFHYVN